MAVNAGKITPTGDSTFAALQSRLAAGKGKIEKFVARDRNRKTSWNKTGKKTFAAGKS